MFSNGVPNDHVYVDGGMVYNYPLSIFDTNGQPNPASLGFFLTNLTGAPVTNTLKYDHLIEFVKITFETILDAQNIDLFQDSELLNRTVQIDNLGISATDFDITDAQETDLYNSGVKYTTEWLAAKGL